MAVTLSFTLSFTIPLTSEDVAVKVGPASVGTVTAPLIGRP